MARSLACKWLIVDMGMTGAAAGDILMMSPTAVSRGVERGRDIESKMGVVLK